MTALERAWQAALAAEQRAVFGYGLLGAHLHGSPRLALAVACSDAHEALRDSTAGAIAAAGLAPVPPAADYPGLYPVTSAAQAIALAPRLEDDCAAAWRYLYATAASPDAVAAGGTASAEPSGPSSPVPAGTASPPAAVEPGRLRAPAQAALTASAVRATKWRKATAPDRATTAFPGL